MIVNVKLLLIDIYSFGNLELVKYLVEMGAEINKENYNGRTPLFDACFCGNLDLVK